MRDDDMANFTAADVKRLRDADRRRHDGLQEGARRGRRRLRQGRRDPAHQGRQGRRQARPSATASNGLVAVGCRRRRRAASSSTARPTSWPRASVPAAGRRDRRGRAPSQSRPTRGAAGRRDRQRARPSSEVIDEAAALIGEKIELGRFARFEGGYVDSYLHKSDAATAADDRRAGRRSTATTPSVAKDVAQQVAAHAPAVPHPRRGPGRGGREGAPDRRGRPPARRASPSRRSPRSSRAGSTRYFKDVVLLEQPFVKEQKKTIKQVLDEAGVTVTRFARFQVGQA